MLQPHAHARALLAGTVAVAALASACSTSNPDASPPESASIRPIACPFLLPDGFVEGDDLDCHELEVLDGDRIVTRVPVTVVRSTGGDSTVTPLVLQNGGPGGSPFDELSPRFDLGVLREIRRERDLVIVETRGSRYSDQPLVCDALRHAEQRSASDAEVVDAARTCFDHWASIGVDLSDVHAPGLADDIAAATELLGYDTFDYYGVSFGTVIGQHLLRDHSDRLRGVVLDAVAPLGVDYLTAAPQNFDAALTVVEQACAGDPVCDAVTDGSFREAFRSAMEELDDSPIRIRIGDELDGRDLEVDGDELASVVFDAMYSGEATPYLPLIVGAGDEPEVAALFELVVRAVREPDPWGDDGAVGLNLGATCAEVGAGATVPDGARGDWPVEVAAGVADLRLARRACDDFGFAVSSNARREPVASDRAVLLIGGEHDPITPQRWSHAAAAQMPNATVLDLAGWGHGALEHPCAASVLVAYLAHPDAAIDTACADDRPIVFDW